MLGSIILGSCVDGRVEKSLAPAFERVRNFLAANAECASEAILVCQSKKFSYSRPHAHGIAAHVAQRASLHPSLNHGTAYHSEEAVARPNEDT